MLWRRLQPACRRVILEPLPTPGDRLGTHLGRAEEGPDGGVDELDEKGVFGVRQGGGRT